VQEEFEGNYLLLAIWGADAKETARTAQAGPRPDINSASVRPTGSRLLSGAAATA